MGSKDSDVPRLRVELPRLAPGARPRVGIVGAGGVALYAHVPAYRRLQFPVALLYDNNADALNRCLASLGPDGQTTRVVSEMRELLDQLPALGFLDIALPSPMHAPFISLLLDRLGSDCPPLLVQKPLADLATAREIVNRAKGLGVRIGINLTARWLPPFRKLRELIHIGVPGADVTVTILNRGWNRKDGSCWRSRLDRLITFEMAVHHIDLVVWTFGPPNSVYAALQRVPNHGVKGDNVAFITLGYDRGVKVLIIEDWTCRDLEASHFHPTAEEIVVSGSCATVVATPGELRISPDGNPIERYLSDDLWFPDAFAGPAAEFAKALHDKRNSEIDAQGHLEVLHVMDACYRSAATNSVVEV